MKKIVGIICVIFIFSLSGCTIERGDEKYEITDAKDVFDIFMGEVDIPNGGSQEDLTNFVMGDINSLFSGVSLPSGTNVEELKEFVNNSLEKAGLSLDSFDYSDEENIAKLEEYIKSGLEEQGLDSSNIHIVIDKENKNE